MKHGTLNVRYSESPNNKTLWKITESTTSMREGSSDYN